MFKFLRKMWKDKRGNAMLVAAAFLPVLVGSAGLATDTIQWALWKRQLQRAADSAAIAGVYDRVTNGGTTSTATAVSHDLTLDQHTGMSLASGYPHVTFPDDDTGAGLTDQVTVELAVQRRLSFSGLFMSNPPLIRTTATAASVAGTDEFCVVSLESSAANTGISVSGNADIEADCSFMSNSPSNNSAFAKGSAHVHAPSIAAVGGLQHSSNWDIDSYEPYAPALDDPFIDVNPSSSDMHCAGHSVTKGGKTTWVADALTETTNLAAAKDSLGNAANCFSSFSVASGTTMVLPSGTYYINGGDAFIQGNLTCSACTIVLTNSNPSTTATIGKFKVNASSNINISAPTTGTFEGIAVYQDRRATDSSANKNLINGNSASQINGALYFPSQQLEYNGTGSTTATCTLFVSRRIVFTGNSGTSNKFKTGEECDAYGIPTIEGGRRVRLVA